MISISRIFEHICLMVLHLELVIAVQLLISQLLEISLAHVQGW